MALSSLFSLGGVLIALPADAASAAAVATVTAVSPNSGTPAGGTVVTLTGTGFTGASAATFGTTAGTRLTVTSATSLTVTAPPAAPGTVDVTVTTPAGVSSAVTADRFTYASPAIAPKFTAASPPNGTVGSPYDYTIKASGSPAPTFSVASGSLPAGLVLNPSTGVLAGTPKTAGTATFVLKAANTEASVESGAITIRTAARPARAAAALGTGSIAGTVTAATGGAPLGGVSVQVYTPSHAADGPSAAATTAANGTYTVPGLAPSASGYWVCFVPTHATGGPSTSGYQDQCYKNVAWGGGLWVPGAVGGSQATVAVTSGASTTGVDAALVAGGAIHGTVKSGGIGVGGVLVSADFIDTSPPDAVLATATTAADGSYTLAGLPSRTYRVCFDASSATGRGAAGYQNQCYSNVSWPTTSRKPGLTTSVVVSPGPTGGTVAGIDAALVHASSISGSVTVQGSSTAIAGIKVVAYQNGTFDPIATAVTGTNGTYTLADLSPASYYVCFDASTLAGSPANGYQNQCWTTVSWDGTNTIPPGSSPVSLAAGGTVRSGINAALVPAGSISGKVGAATGGGALSGVRVSVWGNAGQVGTGLTRADGTYSVAGLHAGNYTVCFDPRGATGGSSAAGYLAQCFRNAPQPDPGLLPAGTAPVNVAIRAATTGVNAALASASGISGHVSAAGHGLAGISVDVWTVTDQTSGDMVTEATTAADGSYTLPGLAPSTAGYVVCFDAANAFGGASVTGYLGQCYQGKAWTSGHIDSLPTGTTPVVTNAGTVHSSIDANLSSAGGITGTVTDTSSAHTGLNNVDVRVYNNDGVSVAQSTAVNGHYAITGLTPSSAGYAVCFDARRASGGSFTSGYLSQCYRNVAWDGVAVPTSAPFATSEVPVTGGTIQTGIGVALHAAGAISGSVTDPSSAHLGVGHVQVDLFNSTGSQIASASTDANGRYTLPGLAASPTDQVCFDASNATGGSSAGGYANQCYSNQPWRYTWQSPPSASTNVAVTAGSTHTGVSAVLTAYGAISGKVTDSTSAHNGIGGIGISVFDSTGASAGQLDASTEPDGTYTVGALPASTTGYTVCFQGTPYGPLGYQSRCYNNLAWHGYPSGPPPGASSVPVAAGALHTGINSALLPDGGVSGTVTDSSSAHSPVSNVLVKAFAADGSESGQYASTDANGNYQITGLAPSSSGYQVCFYTFADALVRSVGGVSATGYRKQCYANVPWNGYGPPSGTTPVPVTAGAIHAGINAALASAGGISGTVKDSSATHVGVPFENVYLYDSSGTQVGSAVQTRADGTYQIDGLTPSTLGYTVCFSPSALASRSTPLGFQAQCFNNVPWPGGDRPTGTTPVTVTAGTTHSNVNATLAWAGAISGTVTDTTSAHAPLTGAIVDVYAPGSPYISVSGRTDAAGHYTVGGLAPGTNYTVCFDPVHAFGGGSSVGYQGQCYQNVAWSAGNSPPPGTAPVSVSNGATHTGVNAALPAAGAIVGAVTDSSSTHRGVSDVAIRLFDNTGAFLTSAITDANGAYSLPQLPPATSGYTVCFDATNGFGGTSTTGYQSQCYHGVAWAGGYSPASGSTPVSVTGGTATTITVVLNAN